MSITPSPLIETIRASIIGDDQVMRRPVRPAPGDLRRLHRLRPRRSASSRTSSGTRSCRGTPTPTPSRSGTGLQTTRLREDARRIIHDAVGGRRRHRRASSPARARTGAIDKLVGILNLRIPADLDDRYGLSSHIPAEERPVVFIGPFEHHSNELPWRESIADVVIIQEDADGHVDLARLEREPDPLRGDRPLRIGSFSAASNVTGILSDTAGHRRPAPPPRRPLLLGLRRRRALRRHRHGRRDDASTHKDAVFISPHKFIGGPGTPGVLVVRRELLRNRVPDRAGRRHGRLREPERAPLPRRPRAAGGGRHAGHRGVDPRRPGVPAQGGGRQRRHPRARGLVHPAGHRVVERRTRTSRSSGNTDAERLSIVSFMVRATAASTCTTTSSSPLLNDLFGIQSRGGCSCAGPYGHRLLGIDVERSHAVRAGDRGWAARASSRAGCGSTSTTSSPSRCSSTSLDAVDLVATEGWRLLPDYRFDSDTGIWRHRSGAARAAAAPVRLGYGDDGTLSYPASHTRAPESALAGYLDEARDLLGLARASEAVDGGPSVGDLVTADFEALRWFELPSTCLDRP